MALREAASPGPPLAAQSPPHRLGLAFLAAAVLSFLLYVLNGAVAEIRPGNAWSLGFGAAAAVLLVGAAMYGVRRRTMSIGIGRTHTWLELHRYGGALFLLLVLMHSAFRLPSGPLTWGLWILSIWITVSGFVGTLIQKWIPRVLTSALSIEAHHDRIPELIGEIRDRTAALLQTCAEPIRDFHQRNLAATMAAPRPRLIYFLDPSGGVRSRTREFDHLERLLDPGEQAKLGELERLYRTKLELDAHYTLQKALRWWPYAHVPPSLLLVLLFGLHLYAVFHY